MSLHNQRVVVIMPSGQFRGGAEEALRQLIHRREAAGFARIQIVFLEPGPMIEDLRSAGAETVLIEAGRLREPLRLIRCVWAITRVLRRKKPDVVLGWMTKAHIYGGVAARWCGVPAIVFQMGLPDDGWVDRVAWHIPCIGILTCSEFAARLQRKVSHCQVIGVPLAMDDKRFETKDLPTATAAKEKLGFVSGRPLVGLVGRLQRWKGIHVFLAAMADILQVDSSVQGVVVGGAHDLEPDYPDYLQHEARRLGVSNAVKFVGAQRDVQQWMQAMDVVVHASDREPFGIVVVEAMALGKAVVASIPGGPEEIITHEVNGLLVQAGNATELASAIGRYLADPTFARQCGAFAMVRAGEFTATRFAQRFSKAVSWLLLQSTRSTY